MGEALEEVEGGEASLPGLDELCATLLLEKGECISFRFPDLEKRDTFVLCLSMFADGQKKRISSSNSERETTGGRPRRNQTEKSQK